MEDELMKSKNVNGIWMNGIYEWEEGWIKWINIWKWKMNE